MGNIKSFDSFNEEIFGFGSAMTKEDDSSSNYPELLKKAYDNNVLYLEQIYGDIKRGLYDGAVFLLPYSDSNKPERKISINTREKEIKALSGARASKLDISDSPINSWKSKAGGTKFSSDNNSQELMILRKYIDLLKGTKFDRTNPIGSFNEKEKWIKDAIKHPGSLRQSLGKKEGEKITKKDISSEMSKLKNKDRDKDKPGLQLGERDSDKHKKLVLAKTLKGMNE